MSISHRLAAVAALTALLALSTATSALASPGNPPPGNPPRGSGRYSWAVGSHVHVGGNARPGGTYSGPYSGSYTYGGETYAWSSENNQAGTAAVPGNTINGRTLSELARASLALPTLSLHTSPQAPGTASYAKLPVWVWVTYNGPMQPSDTASVPLPGGGTLWAKVEASRPTVSVSVSDPGKAAVHNNCGATGSRYTAAQAGAVPSCGVTFLAPSVGGPYTLTVTARWTVTWSDSTGGSGTFSSPPYPPSRATASVVVTVRELQSINGGG